MAWLRRLLLRLLRRSLDGQTYQVPFNLYSKDGDREVEVRAFSNGQTYIVERERVGDIFEDRHSGSMVGPFASPQAAERFIVSTAWFRGSVQPDEYV